MTDFAAIERGIREAMAAANTPTNREDEQASHREDYKGASVDTRSNKETAPTRTVVQRHTAPLVDVSIEDVMSCFGRRTTPLQAIQAVLAKHGGLPRTPRLTAAINAKAKKELLCTQVEREVIRALDQKQAAGEYLVEKPSTWLSGTRGPIKQLIAPEEPEELDDF